MIDTHVHLYPPEIRDQQERISATEPYFDKLTHNKVHRWGTAEELIERMDQEGIDQCWCFGFAFSDLGLCKECNNYLADAANRYPSRILPFAVVPPRDPKAINEIHRCADLGFVGVGELFPQGQNFDLTDKSHTQNLAQACIDRNLMLNVHTAEPVGHDYVGKGNVGPRQAYELCLNHPDLRVIFAHFGGGLWIYETMPEVKKVLANAAYDTAAWVYLYGVEAVSAAFAAGVGEKILFGTDWPILNNRRFESRLNGLTLQQLEAITHTNPSRFAEQTSKNQPISPQQTNKFNRTILGSSLLMKKS